MGSKGVSNTMLSRLFQTTVRTFSTRTFHPSKRFISTDIHYPTVQQPICLHSEAKQIAETLSANARWIRKLENSCATDCSKSMVYLVAYDEALSVLQKGMLLAKQRAFESAKLRVQPNTMLGFEKVNINEVKCR